MEHTKERILDMALTLFSENGYNAVSVSQLASAVGIKVPSLYSHFSSKQLIFDEMMTSMNRLYAEKSVLNLFGNRDRLSDYETMEQLKPAEIADMVCKQLRFITSNSLIARFRKLLTIEQFRNSLLGNQLELHQYTDVFEYTRGLINHLILKGILKDEDSTVMSLQLMSPLTLEIQRIDRNPDCIDEAEDMIRKHFLLFFKMYGKENENA